jgi:hypothetical protein
MKSKIKNCLFQTANIEVLLSSDEDNKLNFYEISVLNTSGVYSPSPADMEAGSKASEVKSCEATQRAWP